MSLLYPLPGWAVFWSAASIAASSSSFRSICSACVFSFQQAGQIRSGPVAESLLLCFGLCEHSWSRQISRAGAALRFSHRAQLRAVQLDFSLGSDETWRGVLLWCCARKNISCMIWPATLWFSRVQERIFSLIWMSCRLGSRSCCASSFLTPQAHLGISIPAGLPGCFLLLAILISAAAASWPLLPCPILVAGGARPASPVFVVCSARATGFPRLLFAAAYSGWFHQCCDRVSFASATWILCCSRELISRFGEDYCRRKSGLSWAGESKCSVFS
jgi:hypothetical protein